jgi:mRNA interferase MazF
LVNRGEIWWVELPDQKRRPYLIVSRNAILGVLNRVIAVPLTTTIRRIPTEVALGPDDGVPRACVASMDNIENVPKWAFIEQLATLPLERMPEVCAALNVAVDC